MPKNETNGISKTSPKLPDCTAYFQITVFRLGEDSHTDIDHDILAAWLRGRDITSLDRLTLTLSWNRPDIAISEVFVCGQSWTNNELEAAMMEALLCDRVEFVKLLLEQGVSMIRFLTFRKLEKLYNTVS